MVRQVGINCDKITEKTGCYDFFIAIRDRTGVNKGLAVAERFPEIAALVQVKTVDSKTRASPTRVQVSVSNWERMAKNALPTFFVIFDLEGGVVPSSCFIVHVGEVQVCRVLERLANA